MRDSVPAGFRALTGLKEGFVKHMYLDKYGLVTTALGNLIDTSPKSNIMGGTITNAGLNYPWKVGGRKATKEEIMSSWTAVKNSQHLKLNGGGTHGTIPGNIVRLDDSDVESIYRITLEDFENKIRGYFPSYDSWPADGQLGVLSMAWALGPNFSRSYPRFTAAANGIVPDFITMAQESTISDNKGRTDAQAKAFSNAAEVVRAGGDPDTLHFPESVGAFIRANPRKSAGVGVLGIAMFAGATYAGIKYGKAKGWVK